MIQKFCCWCCGLVLTIAPLWAGNFQCEGEEHQVTIQERESGYEIQVVGAHHAYVASGRSRRSAHAGPLAMEFYGAPQSVEGITHVGVLINDASITIGSSSGLLVLLQKTRRFTFALTCRVL